MLINTQQFVDKNNKNTISCTSNNGLSSPPPSNCPIDLTFYCAELPHTHIEQCVSLYNTGLYDDLLLLRHFDNTINSRRPPSGAFHTAKSLPTKFVTTTKQWTKKRRTFGSKASQNVLSISKITSAPHHQPYAATVLRQIRPAKELQPLPLKYFVGITHSGHSVAPFHANCWAKHNGCEDVVAQHNPKDYHCLLPPMTLCFEPLQRVERAQELETHPLRAHCHRTAQQKASLVEKRGEAAAPALSATRFRAILHLKTMAGCRANNGYPPPMSVYNGPYELLRPAEQLTKCDIEAMISRHLPESVTSDENNCSSDNIVVDDGANVRHKSKKAAKIVVTVKSTSAHHGDEATDSNRNKQLLIMPITANVNELRPADELLAVPIDLLCIIGKQPQQKEETTTTTEKRMSEKKLAMKITVTSSEMTKSTVAKSLPDSKEEALDNSGQTLLQLLKREEELECRPIGKFIALTNKQDEDGHDQQKSVTNGKKYTAKIVFKTIAKHKKTNAEKAEEKKVDGTKLHLISREDELVCRPIGEFVTNATKSDNKQAEVTHGEQKATNGAKYTAKIIMKTVNVPQTTQLHELHLFDREDELQCRPIGEFVASINKRARHVGNADQKPKNEKKYTAKISIKVPKEQIGHQQNEVELEKDDDQQQPMHSLQLSKELKHQLIGESVTDASALAQNGDKSNKEQVEDVQCKGFASVVDEGKRMSRKRKRPSANTTLLQGFWQVVHYCNYLYRKAPVGCHFWFSNYRFFIVA